MTQLDASNSLKKTEAAAMDGIFAKRVFVALARKMGFATVRRSNYGNGFTVKLVNKQGQSVPLWESPIGKFGHYDCMQKFHCPSAKWANMLQALNEKTISHICASLEFNPIDVHSIEQLVIDLDLEGFLKNM